MKEMWDIGFLREMIWMIWKMFNFLYGLFDLWE
jgi:hypothetical protein